MESPGQNGDAAHAIGAGAFDSLRHDLVNFLARTAPAVFHKKGSRMTAGGPFITATGWAAACLRMNVSIFHFATFWNKVGIKSTICTSVTVRPVRGPGEPIALVLIDRPRSQLTAPCQRTARLIVSDLMPARTLPPAPRGRHQVLHHRGTVGPDQIHQRITDLTHRHIKQPDQITDQGDTHPQPVGRCPNKGGAHRSTVRRSDWL